MGREVRNIVVCCSLSKHNSEQDEIDERVYAHLVDVIQALCNLQEFQSIDPMVM